MQANLEVFTPFMEPQHMCGYHNHPNKTFEEIALENFLKQAVFDEPIPNMESNKMDCSSVSTRTSSMNENEFF